MKKEDFDMLKIVIILIMYGIAFFIYDALMFFIASKLNNSIMSELIFAIMYILFVLFFFPIILITNLCATYFDD